MEEMETKKEKRDYPLREEFVFKGELQLLFDEKRNKCIRSILWTLEAVLKEKNSDEFKIVRKSVLDSVNDFHREVFSLLNKSI